MRKIFIYILAGVCAICPVCIYTRRKPRQEVSKKLVAMEKGCPFCYAYTKIKNKGKMNQ